MTVIKKEESLEQNPDTTAQECLKRFFSKKGTLQFISSKHDKKSIQIEKGDAVYPICSGGICRSQTLWTMLKPHSEKIILFPPHAARYGWDPYNGQINRFKNISQETIYDEFVQCFGIEKAQRFGFEHALKWESLEKSSTPEALQQITHFYNENYFGPRSRSERRGLFIAFASNAHVVIHRLCQANSTLENVTVVAIDLEDIISHPPEFLNTTPRSKAAYIHFANLLSDLFAHRGPE